MLLPLFWLAGTSSICRACTAFQYSPSTYRDRCQSESVRRWDLLHHGPSERLRRPCRNGRAPLRGSLNSPACVLITYCRKRIPKEAQNKQIPTILSADYKDATTVGNNRMSLNTRNIQLRFESSSNCVHKFLLYTFKTLLWLPPPKPWNLRVASESLAIIPLINP